MGLPKYLQIYKEKTGVKENNPRILNQEWFKQADYGLFLHYGLYSHLGKGEWVMYRSKIHVKKYAKLKNKFTAENFDADHIASFAKDCGMKYINITTRHHDSFCLWDTKFTDFNVMNSPAKRDLVKELADACEKYGIALFLYYSHGLDWRHPHGPTPEEWEEHARPKYKRKEKTYKYGDQHDLNIYVQFMSNQIHELLTQYPTVAGIWLDGIVTPLSGDYKKLKVDELYQRIRETSPHALISYKQGLLGTEDYFAPERHVPDKSTDQKRKGKIFDYPDKKIEVCSTITGTWGYRANAKNKTVDEVLELLQEVNGKGANLLLNIGPSPDGTLDPQAEKILRKVAKRRNKQN